MSSRYHGPEPPGIPWRRISNLVPKTPSAPTTPRASIASTASVPATPTTPVRFVPQWESSVERLEKPSLRSRATSTTARLSQQWAADATHHDILSFKNGDALRDPVKIEEQKELKSPFTTPTRHSLSAHDGSLRASSGPRPKTIAFATPSSTSSSTSQEQSKASTRLVVSLPPPPISLAENPSTPLPEYNAWSGKHHWKPRFSPQSSSLGRSASVIYKPRLPDGIAVPTSPNEREIYDEIQSNISIISAAFQEKDSTTSEAEANIAAAEYVEGELWREFENSFAQMDSSDRLSKLMAANREEEKAVARFFVDTTPTATDYDDALKTVRDISEKQKRPSMSLPATAEYLVWATKIVEDVLFQQRAAADRTRRFEVEDVSSDDEEWKNKSVKSIAQVLADARKKRTSRREGDSLGWPKRQVRSEELEALKTEEAVSTPTKTESSYVATEEEPPSMATEEEPPSMATEEEPPSMATEEEPPSMATEEEPPSMATEEESPSKARSVRNVRQSMIRREKGKAPNPNALENWAEQIQEYLEDDEKKEEEKEKMEANGETIGLAITKD
jgi:hypothetical protein